MGVVSFERTLFVDLRVHAIMNETARAIVLATTANKPNVPTMRPQRLCIMHFALCEGGGLVAAEADRRADGRTDGQALLERCEDAFKKQAWIRWQIVLSWRSSFRHRRKSFSFFCGKKLNLGCLFPFF